MKWGKKKSRDKPVAEKSYVQRSKPKLTVKLHKCIGKSKPSAAFQE
jgi:hypothetical protein